ncbi:RING/FYVE/PHD zinc finger superfamily protein isoform 3, partial [Theobroma cacao]
RDLDKSLQEIVRQNEQRCEQEIEDIRRGVRAGNITPDTSLLRFSDEALDEQKHSIRIADEKVALAIQAYDLVDSHIQQLDQYLKKSDEELRRERENAAATASSGPSPDSTTKSGRPSESGRGGRKKRSRILSLEKIIPRKKKNLIFLPLHATYVSLVYMMSFEPHISHRTRLATAAAGKIEWFHFGCVGLKEQPKGKWYCSDCAALRNRRKGRG